MISEMAMEDIDALQKQGINITPEEIIRLNALGVKSQNNQDASSFYSLPRCAFLGSGDQTIVFVEPTIGHQIWLDNVCRMYDEEDETTIFMLKAFSLSQDQSTLPKWQDYETLQSQLKKFIMNTLSKYTIRQVISCLNYVMNGADANDFEYPPLTEEDKKCLEEVDNDNPYSSAIGVLHEAMSLSIGLTIEDAKKMTKSELQEIIQRTYEVKGIDVSKNIKQRAIGDYYATLEEIKNKYKKKSSED